MDRSTDKTRRVRRGLIGAAALMVFAPSAWAVAGHWRRVARRTTVVVAGTASAEAASAEQQQAAANSAKAAADASAAAAQQSAAAAQQAEAQAKAAAAQPASSQSAQAKLKELQSLYDQKLISASDYEAAKTKVLNEMTK